MIGRSRSWQASSVASCASTPASRWALANSTIRIAFLHARPTSTMKPTCVKMLMSIWAMFTPAIEQSRHIGTTRITASGSDQLSYWAASTRNTSTTASMKANMAVLPVCSCKQRQLGPLGPHRLRQLLLDQPLHRVDRLARADARAPGSG